MDISPQINTLPIAPVASTLVGDAVAPAVTVTVPKLTVLSTPSVTDRQRCHPQRYGYMEYSSPVTTTACDSSNTNVSVSNNSGTSNRSPVAFDPCNDRNNRISGDSNGAYSASACNQASCTFNTGERFASPRRRQCLLIQLFLSGACSGTEPRAVVASSPVT